MPDTLTQRAVEEVIEQREPAFTGLAGQLPGGFPEQIFNDTRAAALKRVPGLETALDMLRS